MQQRKYRGTRFMPLGTRALRTSVAAVGTSLRIALVLAVVLSVTAFAPTGTAYAAGVTYYVAKTGSDTTGNGSASSPWATIQKAANSMGAGDTVRVAAGTYNERVNIPTTKSGTSGATTKFIADGRVVVAKGLAVQSNYTELTGFEVTPGNDASGLADYSGHVEINGSYNTLTNINVHDIAYTGTGIAFGINSAYNTVNGFKVSNVKHYGAFFIAWWDSAKGVGAHHNVLKNGTINNFGGNAGVNMAGANNTLDGVEIYGPSGWNNYSDGDGIRFIGPNMTVRNSKVHILQDNDPLGTNQPHTDQMQFWKYADGLLIENSVIGTTEPGRWDALKGSCLMAEVRSGDSVTFTIRNSVFLNTDGASYGGGLTAAGAGYLKGNFYNNVFWTPGVDVPSGSVLRNNVFKKFRTETSSLPINSDYNVFITGSTINPNEGSNTVTVADPGFVNPDISSATRYGIDADWRPKSTSILVNRGDATYAPTTDKAGVTRDSRPDIGAYEYVAASAPVDTTVPTVALTSPASGATVSGSVPLAASASDNVAVSKVEFRVDGVLVGSDTTAPYTAVWDASSAAPGSHTIQARAFDAAGNYANSSLNVNVPQPADTTVPTVALTSPASGATVSGSVPLAASASDNVAVSKVEFRVDGTLVGSDSTAPYTGTWNASSAAPGSHTIQARAIDAAGNYANSSVTVNVPQPADTTAPTVALTSPESGATVSGSVPLAANASDNVAISSVEFRVDGALVGTDSTVPYTAIWNASTATPGSHTIEVRAVDTAGNVAYDALLVNVPQPADTTAPVTTAQVDRAASATGWYTSVPFVTLTANEPANIVYQWDDQSGPWTIYTAPLEAPQGTHTLYYRAIDDSGNLSDIKGLTLKVDTIAPAAPVLAASTGADRVSLTWSKASDAVATRVVRSTTSYVTSPTSSSATLVYEGLATAVSDPIVVGATTYYYTAFSRDAAGNWSVGGHAATELGAMSLDLAASSTKVRTNRYVSLKGSHRVGGELAASDTPVTVSVYQSGQWVKIGNASYNTTTKTYEYKTRVKTTSSFRMECTSEPVVSNTVTVSVVR